MSFERLEKRTIAVVVDPIQSVKGKVVIDAFKLINQKVQLQGLEFQQTTSNLAKLKQPSPEALYHGLNTHYFSLVIDYKKNVNDQNMLLNMYKKE